MLILLGADEIVMSHRGELGPLDVQLFKTDEMVRASGLDIFGALTTLQDYAFSIFEYSFLEIKRRSGGTITTKTAADIATALSVGLLSPISGQIDPLRLGEVRRAMDIALCYGQRLTINHQALDMLVMGYPSHTFAIDCNEASDLFGNVRVPNESELDLEGVLREFWSGTEYQDCMRTPHSTGAITYFNIEEEDTTDVANGENFPSEHKETELPDETPEEQSAESDHQTIEDGPSAPHKQTD